MNKNPELCWLRKPISGFVTIVTLRPYLVNSIDLSNMQHKVYMYTKQIIIITTIITRIRLTEIPGPNIRDFSFKNRFV